MSSITKTVKKTANGWISVKDRLPTHYDRVPVLTRFRGSNNFRTSWM